MFGYAVAPTQRLNVSCIPCRILFPLQKAVNPQAIHALPPARAARNFRRFPGRRWKAISIKLTSHGSCNPGLWVKTSLGYCSGSAGGLPVGSDFVLHNLQVSAAPKIRGLDIVVGVGIPAFLGGEFIELVKQQKNGIELFRVPHEGIEGRVVPIWSESKSIVRTIGRSV